MSQSLASVSPTAITTIQANPLERYYQPVFSKIWTIINSSEGLKAIFRVFQFGALSVQVSTSHKGTHHVCQIVVAKAMGARNFIENFDFIEDWSSTAEAKAHAKKRHAFESDYTKGPISTIYKTSAMGADVFNRISNFFSPVTWVLEYGVIKNAQKAFRICTIAGNIVLLAFLGCDIITRLAHIRLLDTTLTERRQALVQPLSQRDIQVVDTLDRTLDSTPAAQWGETISNEIQARSLNLTPHAQTAIHTFYQNKQKAQHERTKNWISIATDVSYTALVVLGGFIISLSLPMVAAIGLSHAIFNFTRAAYNTHSLGHWTPRLIPQTV